jgi:hypothetical protein
MNWHAIFGVPEVEPKDPVIWEGDPVDSNCKIQSIRIPLKILALHCVATRLLHSGEGTPYERH